MVKTLQILFVFVGVVARRVTKLIGVFFFFGFPFLAKMYTSERKHRTYRSLHSLELILNGCKGIGTSGEGSKGSGFRIA